jgi:hypothetical protein
VQAAEERIDGAAGHGSEIRDFGSIQATAKRQVEKAIVAGAQGAGRTPSAGDELGVKASLLQACKAVIDEREPCLAVWSRIDPAAMLQSIEGLVESEAPEPRAKAQVCRPVAMMLNRVHNGGFDDGPGNGFVQADTDGKVEEERDVPSCQLRRGRTVALRSAFGEQFVWH